MDIYLIIHTLYDQFQTVASNSIFQDFGLVGLFFNSILSATALPLPTEPLTASLLAGGESKLLVGSVLLLGSIVGGVMNYWIGFGGKSLGSKIRKLIKKPDTVQVIEEKHKSKVEKILEKLGWFGIFFSPFILVVGDLILITCGAKRYDFKKYLLVMICGKLFKTVVVIIGLGMLFH